MHNIMITLFFLLSIQCHVFGQVKTENVVLVTLDGLRWQELFSGADETLVGNKKFVSDSAGLVKKYWRGTAEERRKTLMPFFWSTLATQGQLYGNRNLKNKVNVTNQMVFSYPGYNEILTGAADDQRITSNNKINNPNMTVLEAINKDKRFSGKVAAFTSWDCFPYIINAERSGIPVSSGIVTQEKLPTETEKLINELMYEIPNPLGDVRLDAFTFYYAMEYLKKNKPRVLYIGFDETDDFAHGGKYDLYLEAAHYTDRMIAKLWQWIQADPQYKDKTTMIITTDHGRGIHNDEAWKHHGIKMPNADQIWIAVIGPDTPAMGEVSKEGQLYQNQVAQTIAQFLRVKFDPEKKTGEPIQSVIKVK